MDRHDDGRKREIIEQLRVRFGLRSRGTSVLRVMIFCGHEEPTGWHYHGSVADIARAANIPPKTAGRGIDDLQEHGIVCSHWRGNGYRKRYLVRADVITGEACFFGDPPRQNTLPQTTDQGHSEVAKATPESGQGHRGGGKGGSPQKSTDPRLKDSTDPHCGSVECGVSKKHSWGRDLTREELRDPEAIQRLYRQAVAGGLVSDSENHRLAFFRWARHCDRTGDNPPALFNIGLRKADKHGNHWHQRGSAEDEDWARAAISRLRSVSCPQAQELIAEVAAAFGRELDR